MYLSAIFTALQLFYNARHFSKIKFFLSWWAYSFPISALVTASFVMYENSDFVLYKYTAIGLYVFLIGLITYLFFKTIKCMAIRTICVPEED